MVEEGCIIEKVDIMMVNGAIIKWQEKVFIQI